MRINYGVLLRKNPLHTRFLVAKMAFFNRDFQRSKEIKKFVTNERIAEKVSLFDYMFYSFTSITGANLGPIQKTRFDTLAIKQIIINEKYY